jgi:hypothetical protein
MKTLTNYLIILVLLIGIVASFYLYLNPDRVNWSELLGKYEITDIDTQDEEEIRKDTEENPKVETREVGEDEVMTKIVEFAPDKENYYGFEYCNEDSECKVLGAKQSFFSFVPKLSEKYAFIFEDYTKCEILEEIEYCRLIGNFKYRREF